MSNRSGDPRGGGADSESVNFDTRPDTGAKCLGRTLRVDRKCPRVSMQRPVEWRSSAVEGSSAVTAFES
jgi:hypothetical protein